ncbi:MAG TPA: YceH family protein [Thermoanaerobaculia bacterium]|nr:YceH family protein [Thermoanaerobaculia bacterium]
MSTRIPRQLDPVEIRVLGSLLEKEQTNPETVPMTVNAVILACNQKTNREPVMQLTEDQVVNALDRLRQDVLAWRTEGARTERWQQSVVRRWGLDRAGKALMTLLLLRGPQTPGELRTRSERMFSFASLEEVEEALRRLAGMDEPLVRDLPRRPGQKEIRWIHLVGELAPEPDPVEVAEPPEAMALAAARPGLASRVERLEDLVEKLAADLEELKKQLGI